MLNLLFISNSPKAQYMKSSLQPVLKVIIDVVPDFDHGLKDVFEKRPATVCIQEHIAGVTGESVARHIQMLLGSGSPRFILMHEGSSKAKSINGLFEHVIDLNQPDAALVENFQDILKALLGDQWTKIFIPPKQTRTNVGASISIPEESQADADRMVDDFLSDFDSHSFTFDESSAVPDLSNGKSDSTDDVARMLLDQVQSQNNAIDTGNQLEVLAVPEPEKTLNPPPVPVSIGSPSVAIKPDSFKNAPVQAIEKTVATTGVSTVSSSTVTDSKPLTTAQASVPVSTPVSAKIESAPSTTPVAPAEFKIRDEKKSSEEVIPEELLHAFEKNYRTESAFIKRKLLILSVLLVAAVGGGGWYVLEKKPDLLDSFKQRLMPSRVSAVKQNSSAPQSSKSQLSSPSSKEAATKVLPKFIPVDGHDKKYAAGHPGWERYVGKNLEIRVFNADGAIKAVQVLSKSGNGLPEQFLKSVLSELAGSSDYKIESRKLSSGVMELRGTVGQKADIIIYMKKKIVRAFVVSMN